MYMYRCIDLRLSRRARALEELRAGSRRPTWGSREDILLLRKGLVPGGMIVISNNNANDNDDDNTNNS